MARFDDLETMRRALSLPCQRLTAICKHFPCRAWLLCCNARHEPQLSPQGRRV